MSPRQFLDTRKFTLAEMASLVRKHHPRKTGPNASTVLKQVRGQLFPSVDMIEAWREATGGKVLYEDWIALRETVSAAREAHAAE